jgi:aminopeptidase N
LRQLTALVGVESFSAALSEYFQNHKFANTDLKDLLDVFQKHLGSRVSEHKAYDIPNWQASWLEKAGLNTVTAEWTPGNNTVKLIQGAVLPEHPTLRFHRIDVAFYDAEGNVVINKEVILNDSEVTEITVEGLGDNIVAVLPNYNDYSFIKVIFDSASQTWFENNLTKISEPLSTGLILRSFYDGVRDARYKASQFITVASGLISQINDNQIIDLAYQYIGGCISIIPGSKYSDVAHTLYQTTRTKVTGSEDPQFILSMVEKLIGYGFQEDDVADLKSWLEGTNEELGKNELSLSQKWSIVYKINGCSKFSAEEGKAAFDKLYAEDDSDTKKNFKLRIEAVNADTAAREALLAEYFNADTKLSYVELASSCAGFTSKFLPFETKQTYFDTFWSKIIEAMKTRSRSVAMVRLIFNFSLTNPKLDLMERIIAIPR